LSFPTGGSAAVETASKTYIEMIKSQALVSEVVRELRLDR
jgi:capsular polysaccharide biosynthesis protein